MTKPPLAGAPRATITIPMTMAAIATGQTKTHAPQPTNGMNETTSVIPMRIQLTNARIFVLRAGWAGWTMEAFVRVGAAEGGTVAGAGVGAGVGAGLAAAEGGITTPATLESGAQPAAPSYQARSEAANVPSASFRFTSSREKGPSCWPFLPT